MPSTDSSASSVAKGSDSPAAVGKSTSGPMISKVCALIWVALKYSATAPTTVTP